MSKKTREKEEKGKLMNNRQKKYKKALVVRVTDENYRATAKAAIFALYGKDTSDFLRDKMQEAIDKAKKLKLIKED